MAENYEVTSVREITDVNPETGDLEDYIEAHAKTKPNGVAITVRIPAAGASTADVAAKLAEKAGMVESLHTL